MPNLKGSALNRRKIWLTLSLCALSLQPFGVQAQTNVAPSDRFQFISDGPSGSGWGRTDELPRVFFPERLPAFFSRTILFDTGIPREAKLNWIFTGAQGGFTVELSRSQVRVSQRFYDSYGLNDSHTSNPERIVQDSVGQVPQPIHSLTVVLDAHLSLKILVNGSALLEQNCMLDVSRHQLQFQAPRSKHLEVSGSLAASPSISTVVTIHPDHRHQTIYGFGGSPSIPAYESLSEEGKKQYWRILAHYNLLIDREYPMGTRLRPDMSNLDNLADASPHYYGDNFPNGEVSSFAYNAHTKKIGGKVIYELWALPNWATKTYVDPEGKEHKDAADPKEWARAMLTYTRISKEKTGYAPDVIGIQNEVGQPKAITFEMVRTLRRELDAAGFQDVKIHMPDASYTWLGKDVATTLKSDSDIWSKIDIAATHEYDYQDHFYDPDSFDEDLKQLRAAEGDKPFLATEICINNNRLQIASYRVAFNVGQLYHKNMTILDSIGLLYCWLILDVEQPNFGASRALLIPDRYHGDIPTASSFQLRVLGAYSRHLPEGMVRVEANSSNSDLLVSAFEGKGDARTVILANRGTSPQTITMNWPGTKWRETERASQYLENTPETVSSSLVIQPGEIVTLSTLPAPAAE
jgi:O-glycosyl hydrolase